MLNKWTKATNLLSYVFILEWVRVYIDDHSMTMIAPVDRLSSN